MSKVFISYSSNDKPFVSWLIEQLKKVDIDIGYDEFELNAGDILEEKIRSGIIGSNLFLVVLSKTSLSSKWVSFELNEALVYSAQKNGVKIIPILLENEAVMPSSLSMIKCIDFSFDKDSSLQELITVILASKNKEVYIPDWDSLSSSDFENMTYDLLQKYGLKNIVRNNHFRDYSFDFTGNYFKNDKRERWIVESKFYNNSKVSVNTIANLYGITKLSSADTLLIITNSSLTSSSLNFIKNNIKDIKVKIWDEFFLTDLIIEHSDIHNKYFVKEKFIENKTSIYDDELIKIQNYINRLKNCPEGKAGWKEYENICIDILNYLFVPPLKEPKIQSRTESGVDIRDAIYPNRGKHENWGFIRNDYDAKYIVFEFKNYSTSENGANIDKHVVNQVRYYLKPTIGRMGFLCSSKKPNNSAYEARKQAFNDDKKLILFLNNEHLIDMLMKKYRKIEPSNVIVDLIDDFNISFG